MFLKKLLKRNKLSPKDQKLMDDYNKGLILSVDGKTDNKEKFNRIKANVQKKD